MTSLLNKRLQKNKKNIFRKFCNLSKRLTVIIYNDDQQRPTIY